ncbi:unnamed protein product [Notodromas monacha]|uniref:Coiled-coil domain-containing protein 22 homolog n=1 Tax=Notodromas monacha TaxID=399045 RepID=A0A7R9BEK8_9CRUS|nr:unnamed protein product [Notodromas monacha]CAG0913948.1 unnamed protein product [Notodromas monacha]
MYALKRLNRRRDEFVDLVYDGDEAQRSVMGWEVRDFVRSSKRKRGVSSSVNYRVRARREAECKISVLPSNPCICQLSSCDDRSTACSCEVGKERSGNEAASCVQISESEGQKQSFPGGILEDISDQIQDSVFENSHSAFSCEDSCFAVSSDPSSDAEELPISQKACAENPYAAQEPSVQYTRELNASEHDDVSFVEAKDVIYQLEVEQPCNTFSKYGSDTRSFFCEKPDICSPVTNVISVPSKIPEISDEVTVAAVSVEEVGEQKLVHCNAHDATFHSWDGIIGGKRMIFVARMVFFYIYLLPEAVNVSETQKMCIPLRRLKSLPEVEQFETEAGSSSATAEPLTKNRWKQMEVDSSEKFPVIEPYDGLRMILFADVCRPMRSPVDVAESPELEVLRAKASECRVSALKNASLSLQPEPPRDVSPPSLRHSGFEFDASYSSLSQFKVDDAIKSSLHCLHAIGHLKSVSSKEVPQNTAAKFRLCNDISSAVKKLGYDGDLGYQTFLYISHAELRSILLFLLARVPSDGDPVGDGERKSSVMTQVKAALNKSLTIPWIPWYCRKAPNVMKFCPDELHLSRTEGYSATCEKLTVDKRHLLPTLISAYALCKASRDVERNSAKKLRNQKRVTGLLRQELSDCRIDASRNIDAFRCPDVVANFDIVSQREASNPAKPEVLREEELLREEEEKSELRNEIEAVEESLRKIEKEIIKLEGKVKQANDVILTDRAEMETTKKEYLVKKRAFDFLPDAPKNVEKLIAVNKLAGEKLHEAEQSWNERKLAMTKKIEDLRNDWLKEQESSDVLKDELVALEERVKLLENDTRVKTAQIERIISSTKVRSKEADRSVYTQRILEVVNSIKKQCKGIDKVLEDTRSLQKSINLLEGKLDRSFTSADELVFKDAKKDEMNRRAYKSLAAIREGYDMLISTVREIGSMTREIRDLEDQVEEDKAKNVVSNLEGIQRDFAEMRAENAVLKVKLEELKASGNN